MRKTLLDLYLFLPKTPSYISPSIGSPIKHGHATQRWLMLQNRQSISSKSRCHAGPLSGLNGQMDIVKHGLVPKITARFRKHKFFRSRENPSGLWGFRINEFRIKEALMYIYYAIIRNQVCSFYLQHTLYAFVRLCSSQSHVLNK